MRVGQWWEELIICDNKMWILYIYSCLVPLKVSEQVLGGISQTPKISQASNCCLFLSSFGFWSNTKSNLFLFHSDTKAKTTTTTEVSEGHVWPLGMLGILFHHWPSSEKWNQDFFVDVSGQNSTQKQTKHEFHFWRHKINMDMKWNDLEWAHHRGLELHMETIWLCLHVGAALCSHGAVHTQRLGQHGWSVVNGHMTNTAVERWQVVVYAGNSDAIWWAEVQQLQEEKAMMNNYRSSLATDHHHGAYVGQSWGYRCTNV